MKRTLAVLAGLVLALSLAVIRPAHACALNVCTLQMVISATDVHPGPDARYTGSAIGVLTSTRVGTLPQVKQVSGTFETTTIKMTPVLVLGEGGGSDTAGTPVGSQGTGTATVTVGSQTYTATISLVTSGAGQGVATFLGYGGGVVSGSQLTGKGTFIKSSL